MLSAPLRTPKKRNGKSAPKPRAATPATDPVVDIAVGKRIRQLRSDRGLGLEAIAARTGLSIGYLSQIERGLSSPSLRALASLTGAFGVPLGDLFGTLAPGKASDPIVIRERDRARLTLWRHGISKRLLTAPAGNSKLALYLVHMEPGASSGDEFYAHQGEEAGMVMDGSMTLTVGDETWQLAQGDSFRFPSTTLHRFANPGRKPATVLWINCS